MNKKTLQILADADNKLLDAEKSFLKTLPYDDGSVITRHSGKYYDFGGVMSGIGSMAKSVLDDSLDTTYDDLKRQKEYNNRSVLSGVSDNNALMMAMDNLQWGQEYTDKDFRDVSVWDDVSDTIMGGISGAMATKSPWGLLAALPVAGNKIVNRLRARKERIKGNDDLTAFNSRLSNMLSATAQNVDAMNDRRLLESFYNSAAFGGDLNTHGADWDNGLTYINAGGTHESNPYDGVPAGTDESGIPNLVEEGEVIWDNQYVFSNRLKVPKKLLDKYKLGGPLTYADAIKKVTKESEERKNDPISNATTKAIVNEFIDSQEEVRMKKQQRAAAKVQQAQFKADLLNALAVLGGEEQPLAPMDTQAPVQQVPQEAPVIEQVGAYGGNLFGTGGYFTFDGIWYPDKSSAEKYNKEHGVTTPVVEVSDEVIGPQEQLWPLKPINLGTETPPKTEKPATKSSGSTPAGQIPYDKKMTAAQVKEFENQADYKNFLNMMKDNPEMAGQWIERLNNGDFGTLNGYKIKDIDDWYRLATDGKMGPIHNATLDAANAWRAGEATSPKREPLLPEISNPNSLDSVLAEYNSSLKSGNKTIEKPIPEAIDDEAAAPKANTNYSGLMRNAPIIGSAVQSILGLMGSPDYSNADAVLEAAERIGTPISIPVETIGDYMQRRPFDERYLVNMANQNRAAASRSAANTAGGNRAMQLGADAFLAHSNQQELGEIMRQAYLANRQDEFNTAEFNRGTNLQNMSAINSRNLAQAQLNTQRQQAGLSGIITDKYETKYL